MADISCHIKEQDVLPKKKEGTSFTKSLFILLVKIQTNQFGRRKRKQEIFHENHSFRWFFPPNSLLVFPRIFTGG
jgi:hypothetical protein